MSQKLTPGPASSGMAAARSAAATALSLTSRLATRLAYSASSRTDPSAGVGVVARIAQGLTTVASVTETAGERIGRLDPPMTPPVAFARGSRPDIDAQELSAASMEHSEAPPESEESQNPSDDDRSASSAEPSDDVRNVEPDPPQTGDEREPVVRERVSWVDYGFVALAIVSVGLLIAEQVIPIYVQDAGEILYWLVIADVAICGLFAIEFFARMRGQPSKWGYAKSRWYDILGMIPVSHPIFRSFRLIRIVRIAVITSRLVRATNRSFGEMLVESTVRRFRNTLVDVIGGAVVVRGVDMVRPWLIRARFAEQIGDAMELRRADIRRMVQDSMRKLPGGRMLSANPMRGMVERAETAAVQAVIDTLRSDELNRLVQHSTEKVIEELRASIASSDRQPPT